MKEAQKNTKKVRNLKVGKRIFALALASTVGFVIYKNVKEYNSPLDYDLETLLNAFPKNSVSVAIQSDNSLKELVKALENSLYISETVNNLKLSKEEIKSIKVQNVTSLNIKEFNKVYSNYNELKKSVKKSDGLTNDSVKLYKYGQMLNQYADFANAFLNESANDILSVLARTVINDFLIQATGLENIIIGKEITSYFNTDGTDDKNLTINTKGDVLDELINLSNISTPIQNTSTEYSGDRNDYIKKALSDIKVAALTTTVSLSTSKKNGNDENIEEDSIVGVDYVVKTKQPLLPKKVIIDQVEAIESLNDTAKVLSKTK